MLEYNTIILEMKKKIFKTFSEAVEYLKTSEKRNITKHFRAMGGEFYADYKYIFKDNRVTIDVFDLLSDALIERFEYTIVKE